MKNPKIVIIGAGSLQFSSRLIADILSYPALQGKLPADKPLMYDTVAEGTIERHIDPAEEH